MKPVGIEATPYSKQLIGNVINAFKEIPEAKTDKNHLHYQLFASSIKGDSLLLSDVYKNKPDEKTSKLFVHNNIQASIENDTGKITLEKKPFYIGVKTAVKKIMNFLEFIQPDNLAKKVEVVEPVKDASTEYHSRTEFFKKRVLVNEAENIPVTIEERIIGTDYTPEG